MILSRITPVLISFIFTLISTVTRAQYISVDPNYTAEQLVKDVFFGNASTGCIQVSNITINGDSFSSGDKSFGYFNRNGSAFELEEGLLLTTGKLSAAPGPNNNLQSETGSGWDGDRDLEDALNIRNSFNATILEFDFTTSNVNRIGFDYIFASEQYLRTNDTGSCNYTDGFAFLIKEAGTTAPYRNLAVIPGTDIPITSSNVRGPGGLCRPVNESYFGQFNPEESPVNFNGQTKILTAVTDVNPGTTYHLKLVIADQGNRYYDSGVFLKAGGFMANKDLEPNRLISTNNALCDGSTLTLDATTAGAAYSWFKDGTQIPGESSAQYAVTDAGLYEVMIEIPGCKIKGSVKIEYALKPIVEEKEFCSYNNEAPIPINLQSLNSDIISNYQPYFRVKYFADAILSTELPNTWSYSSDVTIYAEVSSGNCAPIVVPVHLNTPRRSAMLQDQTICASATTTLRAENTFVYFKWMRENGEIISEGNNTDFIDDVPVGKYTVELTSTNGCKLQQDAIVSTIALPVITHIDVSGNTATVFVSGGQTPYEYSLDGVNFQSSNLFAGLQRGMHTVYVRDALKCSIVSKEFLIINLINIITPNADGKNDLLDYTDLKIKENVSIKIFDRSGTIVYTSKPTDFTWDGKLNGRPLATGTYWYVLSWTEPFTQLPVNYNGWILLKNRN